MAAYRLIGCLADTTPAAEEAFRAICEDARITPLATTEEAATMEAVIVLGGDGFMLHTLHALFPYNIPCYGMNVGTVGFLMNQFSTAAYDHVCRAALTELHPLHMQATTTEGTLHEAYAFNEVSLYRQTHQAAHIRVMVNDLVCMDDPLVADGILLSTAAGSTAYNLSAGGPIIPMGANILALTPLNVFRPRRWRGALLSAASRVNLLVDHPTRRPVTAVADFHEVRSVETVRIAESAERRVRVLFDPDHRLEDRIFKEQFLT